ncbi:type II toxin-antitoxin system Phd/YefM family antitoxin [Thalassococcus sp. BH17M4-6]|uniref:type II toxin-antitoxin system Phd/YefM family antitoxin n=1 Tax=Thalassococcus sp. BH17M4-6 TaxID=3413148 RepID=UPI003BE368C1
MTNQKIVVILTKTKRRGKIMRKVPARAAKHHFGQLIDEARAEPVVVEKHGRPVVVVVSVEHYERLSGVKILKNSDALGSDNEL